VKTCFVKGDNKNIFRKNKKLLVFILNRCILSIISLVVLFYPGELFL